MIHPHHQYITQNSHSLEDSSPNSDSNSVSTASPPHQVSRGSPASTALVMSTNNINSNGHQPNSRQLTPNTNSTAGSSIGHSSSSNNPNTNANQHNGAPNPMIRQFACHAKSMSAGVVVSVPGMSNNMSIGMQHNQNQNQNLINQNMTNGHNAGPNMASANAGHHQRSLAQTGLHSHSGNQNNAANINSHHHHQSSNHHQHMVASNRTNTNVLGQQQVLANNSNNIGRNHRNYHHHSISQQSAPIQSNNSHRHQKHSSHPNQQNHHSNQNSASNNFLHNRQATSSSIILSSNNINNIHNRSASTQLSNVLMGNSQNHHSQTSCHMSNSRSNFPSHVTNSIWSIDENISKSHGKLNTGSYMPHPYLLDPLVTDMSCDNVSNASRLIDGGPPPSGYYLHGRSNLESNPNILSSGTSLNNAQFLPICDLMFNLISMIIYFCENTFGIISLIALYYHGPNKYWALVGAAFVVFSNYLAQCYSFKWSYRIKLENCREKQEAHEELENEQDCERHYYNRMAANMRSHSIGSCNWLPDGATEVQIKCLLSIAIDAVIHLMGLGILARYVKLVIPVTDTARVKKEARDLCMLRLLHGFCQSAPLLLLQTYMIGSQASNSSIINLCVTSAILSLTNLCWALASFTKYARKKHMHKFVLTWLGIISQFLWRIGTVSSRVAALTIYAVYYNYWMLVVLALHWFTMFLWLFKPGNLLRDEVNMSRSKRFLFAIGAAWIYCFCYVNFEEDNSRAKIGLYYLIMFVQNNLLFTVCQTFSSQVTWFKTISILVVYLGFVFGVLFMFLYYKYFHVTALNNGLSCSQDSIDSIADQLSPAGKKIAGFKPGTLRLKSEDSLASGHRYNSNINATLNTGSHSDINKNIKPPYLTLEGDHNPQSGVFSCKLQKMPGTQMRRHN